MQVEYAILASVISLTIAILGFLRTMKKDSSEDASQMTTVLVKLENIQQGINDLKADVSSIKNDIKELDHRLTIEEESLKSAWKQISLLGKEILHD